MEITSAGVAGLFFIGVAVVVYVCRAATIGWGFTRPGRYRCALAYGLTVSGCQEPNSDSFPTNQGITPMVKKWS